MDTRFKRSGDQQFVSSASCNLMFSVRADKLQQCLENTINRNDTAAPVIAP
jgi:hypothetical protein